MTSIDVSRGVPEQLVHDVLIIRVQLLNDGHERHGVFHGEQHQLELGVADLREEHVDAGTFLESPPVFMLETKN